MIFPFEIETRATAVGVVTAILFFILLKLLLNQWRPMNKRLPLYCRVSTGNQSTGLEAQVRALRDYCSRNNIADYVIYEDENQSGIKQSRPALDRMMKDVREGLISKVIVYSFSRYARSVTHLMRALEEFKKQMLALSPSQKT